MILVPAAKCSSDHRIGRDPCPLAVVVEIEAAFETEVGSGRGLRLDVFAVDANRRRAEEPLPLRSFERLDTPELNGLLNVEAIEESAKAWQQRLVARAAVEVEELNPHAQIVGRSLELPKITNHTAKRGTGPSSICRAVIRIRSALSAQRHTLAAASVIVALAFAVVFAHGTPASDHMGGMGGMDDSHTVQSAIVTMCLAVIEVGTAGVGILALWILARRRFTSRARNPRALPLLVASPQGRPPPRARAGPSLLQVYRL